MVKRVQDTYKKSLEMITEKSRLYPLMKAEMLEYRKYQHQYKVTKNLSAEYSSYIIIMCLLNETCNKQ